MNQSYLEFIGSGDRSSCGYCKNQRGTVHGERQEDEADTLQEGEKGSVTTALSIHAITPDHFMRFEEGGWSTSGRYLYKPNNRLTCCPQFTIRLDVTKFKMSRSQKRVMRQMNEFLATGKRPRCAVKEEVPVEEQEGETSEQRVEEQTEKKDTVEQSVAKKVKDADRPVLTKKEIRNKRFEENCRKRNVDPDAIRAERREKEAARQRTVQSYIDEARPEWLHKLEVKMVAIDCEEFNVRDTESFELYKKYQSTIHQDDDSRLAGFRRFLCDSPMSKETRGTVQLGSYHLWFLLDEKLIAVCVVDVLPKCLSAKYMYYDPDYSFLSMGTYTALREIVETQRLQIEYPPLRYYYMGYYIHSCPKMRYKAKFRPSDLLCDESFEWRPFDECRDLLDASTAPNGFVVFRPDKNRPPGVPVEDMLVLTNGMITRFERALALLPAAASNQGLRRKATELCSMVSSDLTSIVYYFTELND